MRSVWRMCKLILGCKGLQEHFSQETTFPRTKLMNQLIQLILSSSKQMFCLIYDNQFRVMSLDDLCRFTNGLWMAQNLNQCCSFAQKCIMNIHNPAFPLVIVSSLHDQPLAILKTLVTSFPNTSSQSVNNIVSWVKHSPGHLYIILVLWIKVLLR